MRFLSVAIAAALSLVGAASIASAQTGRPTLGEVLVDTMGGGGELVILEQPGSRLHSIQIMVPEQKEDVVYNGEVNLSVPDQWIQMGCNMSPEGRGQMAVRIRTKIPVLLEGHSFLEMTVEPTGFTTIYASRNSDLKQVLLPGAYLKKTWKF